MTFKIPRLIIDDHRFVLAGNCILCSNYISPQRREKYPRTCLFNRISDTKSILCADDNIIHTNAVDLGGLLKEKEKDKANFIESVNGAGIGQEINYKVCKMLNIDGRIIEIIN